MKKIIYTFLPAILLFAMATCGVYTSVYSNYDHSIDFSKYNTFAWLPDSGQTARRDSFRNTAYDNDIIRNNVKNFVIRELSERGMRVQVDTPDVLLQLVLLNEKKERIMPYYPPYPLPWPYYMHNPMYFPYYYPYYDYYTYYGWGCTNEYCGYSPAFRDTYVKGTITINMFDRRQKKLVWTGSAEGNIYDPVYIQESIHPAVKRIMQRFPVKTKHSRDED